MRNAGIFPPNTVTHRSSSKRTILVRKHVVWAIGLKRKNRSSGSTWAQDREKSKDRTGQDSKKSHKVVTFRLFREMPPTASIETQICMVGHLADVIMCAKFQDDIFRGYNFTGGRISHFAIDFCMGLATVQLYVARPPMLSCQPHSWWSCSYFDAVLLFLASYHYCAVLLLSTLKFDHS